MTKLLNWIYTIKCFNGIWSFLPKRWKNRSDTKSEILKWADFYIMVPSILLKIFEKKVFKNPTLNKSLSILIFLAKNNWNFLTLLFRLLCGKTASKYVALDSAILVVVVVVIVCCYCCCLCCCSCRCCCCCLCCCWSESEIKINVSILVYLLHILFVIFGWLTNLKFKEMLYYPNLSDILILLLQCKLLKMIIVNVIS